MTFLGRGLLNSRTARPRPMRGGGERRNSDHAGGGSGLHCNTLNGHNSPNLFPRTDFPPTVVRVSRAETPPCVADLRPGNYSRPITLPDPKTGRVPGGARSPSAICCNAHPVANGPIAAF